MTAVAVFGASGQTGRRVVERLLREGHDVLALSRQDVPARQRLRSARVDLSSASTDLLSSVLERADAVVFAAGGDPLRVDRDGAIRTIEAAERAGVGRYVLVTGMGVGRDRPPALYGGFWDTYFGAKEDSERRLRASPMQWTILQPGELLNSPGRGCVEIGPTGSFPIGAISRDDVAEVITTILSRDGAARGTWEILEGTEPIADAVLRALTAD
ncbi:SDR family oxidoreductase [Aeromicrobium chenweiae]|uniref:NAD-dependent dehydratase n=1 Tax=Aeromicrobium chenweiae TaxID=2079793 RepID=A0A2S0WJE1_9ACTN|nr:SDR family oxidoreductase [Aeromicrobium chenweiae]AWB91456.1 NAD-dependent dehydratase [Aeromicrobium chenweiae]TGN29939.1 NAD(P)-dependent oxidoreductase [Aeromicrobium chenweiae]